jgi:hypothetical protein
LEYLSDISWSYSFENENIVLDFYQDESGKNHIEQFAKKIGSVWFSLIATDKQIKAMFDKLEATPYRETEKEYFEDRGDLYEYYGVSRADFY